MKKFILSVFTICALGSWPVIANAQSNNGQNTASSNHNSGGGSIKSVKPKVEAGLNGEFKVTPVVSSANSGRDNVLNKKIAEAQRKAAEAKVKDANKPSNGQPGMSNGSSSDN